MIKKYIKEFFLCALVGGISIIFTVILGSFYSANGKVIIINILVWSAVVLLAYLLVIFWPLWKKKRKRYIDLLAFASGYFGVIIFCLCRAKSVDEYNYLTSISFIAELLALAELIVNANRNVQARINERFFPNDVLKVLENEPVDIKDSLIKILDRYKNEASFSVNDVATILRSTRYYANKVISIGIKANLLCLKPDEKNRYSVVQN